MREWLTVIIALLILAVVLDGIRRMRLTRRSAIRMPPSVTKSKGSGKQGSETYGSELPNGGARVVNVRKPDDAQQSYQKIRQTREEKTRRLGRPNRIPQQVALNLDEHVPTLMEVEQEEQKSTRADSTTQADTTRAKPRRRIEAETQAETAPEELAESLHDERIEPRLSDENIGFDEPTPDKGVEAAASTAWFKRDNDERPRVDADDPSYADEPSYDDAWRGQESETPDYHRAPEAQDEATAEESELREPEEVLVINVMAAKGDRFRGDLLLETVLEQGMRFGSMNIFHHHEHFNGEGGVLYSMANIVVPGTFDLAAIKEFTTPGVSLFLALPVDGDSSKALESMVGTAKAIAGRLGGELKDENRSVMTTQTVEHYRSRIKEFERKQLSKLKRK